MIKHSKTYSSTALIDILKKLDDAPKGDYYELLFKTEYRGHVRNEYSESIFKGIKVTWKTRD